MAFDVNSLNEKNLPWRWRLIGEWMLDNNADMSELHPLYRQVLQVAGGSDYGTSRPAITNVSVASASSGSVVFNVSSHDDDHPITFDMSKSVAVYPNTDPAPTAAETDITLTEGKWTDTGLTAGQHGKYVFAATDSDGVEGPLASVEVVVAPAAVANLAGVDADTTGEGTAINVTFTPATGAASETLYWMEVEGTEDAQDIVDGGTAVSSATSGMTVDPGEAGNYALVVVSTNPGGSSLSNLATVTVTVA